MYVTRALLTFATLGLMNVSAEVDRAGKDRAGVFEEKPYGKIPAPLVLLGIAEDDGLPRDKERA